VLLLLLQRERGERDKKRVTLVTVAAASIQQSVRGYTRILYNNNNTTTTTNHIERVAAMLLHLYSIPFHKKKCVQAYDTIADDDDDEGKNEDKILVM